MKSTADQIRFNLLIDEAQSKVLKGCSNNFLTESCDNKRHVEHIREYFGNISSEDAIFLEMIVSCDEKYVQDLAEAIPGMNWLKRLGKASWDKVAEKAKKIDVSSQIEKLKKMYKVGTTPITKETMKQAYDASSATMVKKYNEILVQFGGNHKIATAVLVTAFVIFMVPGGLILANVWVKMLKALYNKLKAKGFKGGPITKDDIRFEDVVAA